MGALSLLLHCSLWLPVVGPGRVPLALKGAQAPSHPGPPYSTALAAAGVASGGVLAPAFPSQTVFVTTWGSHFSSFPTFPSPCTRLGSPFGSGRQEGVSLLPLHCGHSPLPSAWDLSTCGGDGDAVAYCSGEAHEPCGRHLRWAGAAPLTLLCFRHSAISPSSDGAPITRSSPCPLPTPSCSSLPPRFWFHFSSVHKLPLDSCVVFCSMFHSSTSVIAAATSAKCSSSLPPVLPTIPPPRYSLWGRGAGAWQAG